MSSVTHQTEPPQSFIFLPTDDVDRSSIQSQKCSAINSLLVTRCLLSAEIVISLGFNVALMYAVQHGQYLSILLCAIATSNCLAAAILLCGKRSMEQASGIVAYVIWKVFQEIIVVPMLLIFTVLLLEGFVDGDSASVIIGCILIVLWLYAIYSMAAIVLLGHVARSLWKTKLRVRRSTNASLSTITEPLELSCESEHFISELRSKVT